MIADANGNIRYTNMTEYTKQLEKIKDKQMKFNR